MTEKPEKRGPKVEIIGDPSRFEAFGQATRISEELLKANVFAGLDKAIVPSLAQTFGQVGTKSVLGDVAAFSGVAKTFENMQAIVAPQMAPQIAEALAGIVVPKPLPKTVAAAMAIGIDSAALDFTKILGASYAALPQITKMLQTINLPTEVWKDAATAIAARPDIRASDFAPRVQAAGEQAVAVAEVEDVAEVIDNAFTEIAAMPPAKRRALALDVAMLIAALLMLDAFLTQSGNLEAAGVTLGCAAYLVRVHWRLTGKLD